MIEAARATGARAHILHLSSADALPMIASAIEDGVRLSVETCPHYLTLCAEEIADGATAAKVGPPVREERKPRGALGRHRRRHPQHDRLRPFALHAGDEGARDR